MSPVEELIPDWLDALLPELPLEPPVRVMFADGRFIEDLHPDASYWSLSSVVKSLSGVTAGRGFIFDPSVAYAPGAELVSPSTVFFHDDEKSGVHLLQAEASWETQRGKLLSALTAFQTLDASYREDPTNWAVAYVWADAHPAFWVRGKGDSPFDWVTEGSLSRAWTQVEASPSPCVRIEHGGRAEGDLTLNCHDPRLDVWDADSFESAYVLFAARTDRVFTLTGEVREPGSTDYSPIGLPPQFQRFQTPTQEEKE